MMERLSGDWESRIPKMGRRPVGAWAEGSGGGGSALVEEKRRGGGRKDREDFAHLFPRGGALLAHLCVDDSPTPGVGILDGAPLC